MGGICVQALAQASDVVQKYDLILMDEAQDFPTSFFQLCYQSLRCPKRLVYVYDEPQNLNAKSLPELDELFGINKDSLSNVQVIYDDETEKPRQDIVLKTCYRNSRPTLVAAHALGFGVWHLP